MNWGDSEQGPSNTVQQILRESVSQTEKALTGTKTKSILIVFLAVVVIVFFVKKVSK